MQYDSRVREGDVGNGDDDVRGALVMLPAAVSHVVDPLPIVLSYEPLVLTRIAVVTPGIVSLAAVQTPRYPPIALNLSTKNWPSRSEDDLFVHIFDKLRRYLHAISGHGLHVKNT